MVKAERRNRAVNGGEVAKKTSMHREENETERSKAQRWRRC